MSEILTISQAFEVYRLDYISFRGLSKKTEEAYIVASRLLVRYCGDIDIHDLTFAIVRDWRSSLASRQMPDTVRNNIICLRMVLRFMRSRGYDVLDPDSIPVPKRIARNVEFLDELEFMRFLVEAGRPRRGYDRVNRMRNVAIIQLLYDTGLRNGELCAMNRNTIKNRTFTVIGKGGKARICFVSDNALIAINNYLALRKDTEKALFVSAQTNKRISSGTLREVFKNICDRSEFENIHPHTIRHSFATKLLRHRVDIRYIKEFMGHSSLATTQMYTHVINEDLKDIYDKVHMVTIDTNSPIC